MKRTPTDYVIEVWGRTGEIDAQAIRGRDRLGVDPGLHPQSREVAEGLRRHGAEIVDLDDLIEAIGETGGEWARELFVKLQARPIARDAAVDAAVAPDSTPS